MEAGFPNQSIDFHDDDVCLLVIIIDVNPSQRFITENPENLSLVLDATLTLANMYCLQRPRNKIAIIACHPSSTQFLYPTSDEPPETQQVDGQFEIFTHVENTVKERLGQIIANAPVLTEPEESRLAGSMGMALCYISRMQKQATARVKVHSRILLITGISQCTSQYIVCMNVFFAAQKMGVVLDVCVLDKSLTLLQQGCDMTDGQYFHLTQLDGFLQYLIWVYLPDPHLRRKLVLPPAKQIDYRAACFCHHELISIGYVCQFCLSIFCNIRPFCNTCCTVFDLPKRKKET